MSNTKTHAAVAEFNKMAQHAEDFRDTDAHTAEVMAPYDAWAQGDVAVVYYGEAPPPDIQPMENPSAQLALGDTLGARHMLDNLDECKLYVRVNPHPLFGPIIEAPKGLNVTHPEHGDIRTTPPGWYFIQYQRAHADTLRALQD